MRRAQVENMTKKHFVFMTKDGRISMAGLNSARAEYLARAIDDSVSCPMSYGPCSYTQIRSNLDPPSLPSPKSLAQWRGASLDCLLYLFPQASDCSLRVSQVRNY